VAASAFVVLDGTSVRLSSAALARPAVEQAVSTLAKARQIRERQPPAPKHEHAAKTPAETMR
jgi:hypothetical protein